MNKNVINGIKIMIDKPYPNTEGTILEEKTLKMVEKAFGGKISEMTAVTQYMFQHIITENKSIKHALKQIAITEMKHYEILGNLLNNSNSTPFLGSINFKDNFETWNGSYIYYNKNIKNYLLNNIESEKNAILNYKEIINNSNDLRVKDIFTRIIEDEYRHIEIFYSILATLA